MEHEAGPELNALIARHIFGLATATYRDVFGDTLYIVDTAAVRTSEHSTDATLIGCSWQRGYDKDGTLVEFYGQICPNFSGNISAAWLVVEKMADMGLVVIIKADGLRDGTYNPRYTVLCDNQLRIDASTAPLAICRAALAAREGE